jgi:hypothetical protein
MRILATGVESRVVCGASDARDGCEVSGNVSDNYLEQISLVCHEYVVLKGHNDILVGAEFEVVGDDSRFVLLDLVIICTALFQVSEIPYRQRG